MTFNIALETVTCVSNTYGNAVSVAHTILEFTRRDDADQYILHYDRNEKIGSTVIIRTATRLY